jgi:putative oxidoreductase
MSQSKGKIILSWVLQVLLAVLFLLAALGKITRNPQWIGMFRGYGYSAGFCVLIGALESAGALGLLIPRLTGYAATGLFGIMIGALYTHLSYQQAAQVWRPLVFMLLLAIIIIIRRPWPPR